MGTTRVRPRAHPRSRGENPGVTMHALRHRGSSPLTRGKLGQRPVSAFRPGLIPAHAGKTPTGRQSTGGPGAHPRSRGENNPYPFKVVYRSGSSPLTRGKPSAARVRMTSMGLIPAHAGKTRRRASHTGGRPAHPRSRGENARHRRAHHRPPGSSPLTRGKRAAVSAAPT